MRQVRPAKGRYINRPPQVLIQEFQEHVKATGSPETFADIDNTHPTSVDGAEILCNFRVNRTRRAERDLAPCPICSPSSPKFLEGCLVWYPAEAVIRAIGHECSAKIDADWHKRKQAFKAREEQEAREKFLFENLHQVPELTKRLSEEISIASKHRKIWAEFRKRCPAITQDLRREMASGRLIVRRARSEALEGVVKGSKYYEETVGYVIGQTAVKSNFDHHTKYLPQIKALALVGHGADPESAGLAICEMTSVEMKVVEKTIKRSRRTLEELERINSDFKSFFLPDNIKKINKWAAYLPQGSRFELSVIQSSKRLQVDGDVPFEFFSLAEL